jgi:hypothetical protein
LRFIHESANILYVLALSSFCANCVGQQPTKQYALVAKSPGQVSNQRKNEKRIVLKVNARGELFDEGIHFSFTAYKASDGDELMLIHNEFPSADEAVKYFEKRVGRGVTIIERNKVKDKAGKVVGERIEGDYSQPKSDISTAERGKIILWTYGPHYEEIRSNAFQASRELERQIMNE